MKQESKTLLPHWHEGELPHWTKPFVMQDDADVGAVKYLLTFRRFDLLPETVRHRYLAGQLHLLPYPGSLAFWGVQDCMKLQAQLPMAMQIPLLQAIDRHQASTSGLKVPQAGLFHDASESNHHHNGKSKETVIRTHRWQRVLRDQDELAS